MEHHRNAEACVPSGPTAQPARRSVLRDPIRLERALGIVLWIAFIAVLFHFGR